MFNTNSVFGSFVSLCSIVVEHNINVISEDINVKASEDINVISVEILLHVKT